MGRRSDGIVYHKRGLIAANEPSYNDCCIENGGLDSVSCCSRNMDSHLGSDVARAGFTTIFLCIDIKLKFSSYWQFVVFKNLNVKL